MKVEVRSNSQTSISECINARNKKKTCKLFTPCSKYVGVEVGIDCNCYQLPI